MLTARAGLVTKQQALDALAGTAAVYQHQVGREWRSLQDTTNDPIMAMRRPIPWRSWQRGEDYYAEGALVWLDLARLGRPSRRSALGQECHPGPDWGQHVAHRIPRLAAASDDYDLDAASDRHRHRIAVARRGASCTGCGLG